MEKIVAQICIIGSGPGGMSASLFLSKSKIPHVIVDKNIFPRDKVCGENLDGRVFHVLKRWNPEVIQEMFSKNILQKTHNFCIYLPKATVPIAFNPNSTPRLLGKRIDFDNFLFEKVKNSPYCQIIESELIQDYHFEGEKIVFEGRNLEIEADLGIVACGFQSGLLKNRPSEDELYFFHRVYYKNLLSDNNNEVQTYYFEKPVKTCLLICPLPNNEFNVEIGVSKEDYKKLKVRMEDLLEDLIASNKYLKQKFHTGVPLDKGKGVHLPITSNHQFFSDRNLLYVGASAFCVNPITGMGVGNAVTMGELAAKEVQKYIQMNDFSATATASYEKLARQKLKNVIRLNKLINFFFRHLKLTTPVLLLVVRSKSFLNVISRADLLSNFLKPWYYFTKSTKKS